MVRLTERPDMTLDVYQGHKTTTQQQHNNFRSVLKHKKNHVKLSEMLPKHHEVKQYEIVISVNINHETKIKLSKVLCNYHEVDVKLSEVI